jgi:hypothetical protein
MIVRGDSMSDITREAWWDQTQEYVFRSLWPATDDLLEILWQEHGLSSPPERFLDVPCGPGDFALEAARSRSSLWCMGIDCSAMSVDSARNKLRRPGLVAQMRIWGRLLGMLHLGRLKNGELERIVRRVSAESGLPSGHAEFLARLNQDYVERTRRYPLASPYSFLIRRLEQVGLIRADDSGYHQALVEAALALDDSPAMRVLGAGVAPYPSDRIRFLQCDMNTLTWEGELFDAVVLCEIQPLMCRKGWGWLANTLRLCRAGCTLLYVGARLPESAAGASSETNAVHDYLTNTRQARAARIDSRRFESWWDPLFNERSVGNRVYSHFVVATIGT